ncbi:MAG TPA: SLC13 family permease, partial [Acidimicrobiia bacterium]
LPARRSVRREVAEESRRFTIDMQVEAAGLRHLKGVFLAAVEREGDLQTVAPDTVLRGGDRLRFVGRADDVVDLHTIRGLHSAERSQLVELNHSEARYFEVVIGSASPLIGRTMKEIGFRERYQAVVLAIHRAGQLVDAKLGEVPLRVGDTMILLADRGFRGRWRDRNDFLLVSPMGGMPPVAKTKAALVGLVTLGIVITAAAGLLPILQASLLGVVALLVTGVVSPAEARNAIDLEVIVVIASAFGLAAALETSGLAQTVASGLVEAFGGWGDAGVLLGVVLATVVLTEMITNNAAALLMFPIALSAAEASSLAPRGFALAVAVAASASFLTPIGYQTNTMVYGPGGYRFTDYARLGLPLTLVTIVLTVLLVPVFWPV